MGVPFDDRGRRADDQIGAMRALWEMDDPRYAGRHAAFAGIDAHPRPVQRPVPLIVGGHSAAAMRRAVQRGNGWYGFGLDVPETVTALARLDEARRRFERPAHLGALEVTITPPLRSSERAAYADLGIDRLVLVPSHSLDLDGLHRWLERARAPLSSADPAPDRRHRLGRRPVRPRRHE